MQRNFSRLFLLILRRHYKFRLGANITSHKMDSKITFVFLIASLFGVDDVICRRVPPRILEDCYHNCQCTIGECYREKVDVHCKEMQVVCINSNVTEDLSVLPSNITRLSITGEYMGHTTLDIFARFDKLKKLSLAGNTIRSLKISKPLSYLNYLKLNNNSLCFLPRNNMTKNLRRLKTMAVQHNNLTYIDEIRFPSRLIDLDLSNNFIQSPQQGSFRHLKKLQFLRLKNNSITEIFHLAFKDLLLLEHLILDYNRITRLPTNAFTTLPSASLISLRHNMIETIEKDAFKKLGIKYYGQHEIRLENNEIMFLEEEAIDLLYERREYYSIYLDGNPLFCDCDMMLMRDKADGMFRDSNLISCPGWPDLSLQDIDIPGCVEYDDDEEEYDDYYD